MAATDKFVSQNKGLGSPLTAGEAVTPHDTNELAKVSRALYIGVTGDVVVVMQDGTTLTFKAVPVGLLPVRVKVVKATGTTATNILALS